jgi:UvrD-like helicase family protein
MPSSPAAGSRRSTITLHCVAAAAEADSVALIASGYSQRSPNTERNWSSARPTTGPHIRLKALELAAGGAGPRYDGVIIDEAQDLSAVGMRLLRALDKSRDHRHLLIVGDGQQSIYPGGFGLRELGVDIVGRSRVLTANWRNTWSVWTAARAVMEARSTTISTRTSGYARRATSQSR